MVRFFASLLPFHFCALALFAAEPLPDVPDKILAIGSVSRYGRTAVPADPIQAKFAKGEWKTPKVGEAVRSADGKDRAWAKLPLKVGDNLLRIV